MKPPRGGIARHEIIRRLARGLLVLAFVFQGYVSQAHFHNLAASIAGQGAAQSAAEFALAGGPDISPAAQPENLPANLPDQHNDKCFVCHLVGLGSVSVLPPILVLHTVASALAFTDRGDRPTVPSWDSDHAPRGPPDSFVQA